MSSFTKPLTVTKQKDGLWRVEQSFDYHVGSEDSDDVVHVPAGFLTDFASVPRLFWVILPPDGNYTQAAVLHDYGYWVQERKRSEVDAMFLEAMAVLGVPWWKRHVMHKAVRSFGWLPWNKRAKELRNEKSMEVDKEDN